MEWHLVEADKIEPEAMVVAALGCEPQEAGVEIGGAMKAR
jgi:hypothetical protein